MIKEISVAAKLSQIYTNHCIRVTSVTLLDRAGIPVHHIMQVLGQKQGKHESILRKTNSTWQSKLKLLQLIQWFQLEKPLQQTHNSNKNEIRYQNSFLNTTSPKFVDFGEASFENWNFTFNYNIAKYKCLVYNLLASQ